MDMIFVDISTSGAWLLIFANYGAETSIFADSCFSSSYNKTIILTPSWRQPLLQLLIKLPLSLKFLQKLGMIYLTPNLILSAYIYLKLLYNTISM